jgi:hypothetical protein
MAAGTTYVPIATETLLSSADRIIFNNIPQTYTDIVMSCHVKLTSASTSFIQFNNDTSSELYGNQYFYTNGTSLGGQVLSTYGVRIGEHYAGISTAFFQPVILNIMDYATTNKFKTSLVREDHTGSEVNLGACTWRSTSAITRIDFWSGPTGDLAAGSTVTLYGIACA